MFKEVLFSILFVISCTMMFACDDDSGSKKTRIPKIYIGGYDRDDNATPSVTTPCYWTDTVDSTGSVTKTLLDYPETSEKGGPVYSIFVSGGEVYTGGWHTDASNNTYPCYWTGQTMHPLYYADDHKGSVNSIYVSGGTVYALGADTYGSATSPCYWDGTSDSSQHMLDLTGANSAYARSVFVANGTIYMGGRYVNSATVTNACYWTGSASGTTTSLTPITSATDTASSYEVTSIFVEGSTVYTGGCYKDGASFVPCFWTGTEKTDLAIPEGCTRGFVQSMYVSGGTVYTCGQYRDPDTNLDVACCWIGSSKTDLSAPAADCNDFYANALYVYGGTVYVAGSYFDKDWNTGACYWKDGDCTLLSGEGTYVTATSIFLE